MMRLMVTLLIWLLSLLCLTAVLTHGIGVPLAGAPGRLADRAAEMLQVADFGQPVWLLPALFFYLSFGYVQRAFSEGGFAYAGLVQRRSHKALDKALGLVGAINAVLLWPLSVAVDVIAVLFWHRPTGDYAKEAAEKTLRSMRYGLSREEVEDVVGRYGRLTYMARPLFLCALILTYVTLMLALFSFY